jgi:hypothetical protein
MATLPTKSIINCWHSTGKAYQKATWKRGTDRYLSILLRWRHWYWSIATSYQSTELNWSTTELRSNDHTDTHQLPHGIDCTRDVSLWRLDKPKDILHRANICWHPTGNPVPETLWVQLDQSTILILNQIKATTSYWSTEPRKWYKNRLIPDDTIQSAGVPLARKTNALPEGSSHCEKMPRESNTTNYHNYERAERPLHHHVLVNVGLIQHKDTAWDC